MSEKRGGGPRKWAAQVAETMWRIISGLITGLLVAYCFSGISLGQIHADRDGPPTGANSGPEGREGEDEADEQSGPAWSPPTAPFIQGYASLTSVPQGGQIQFMVQTSEPSFYIRIYRNTTSFATPLLTTGYMPGVNYSYPFNAYAVGCGWPAAYTLDVPSDWTSGVYLAKCTTSSVPQKSWQIPFVVREDNPGSTSPILFNCSVNTWNAYNNWGGRSLYQSNSNDGTLSPTVSFDRPYANVQSSVIGASEYFVWEVHLSRFLESRGYTLEYATDVDLHEDQALLSHYNLFMAVGHPEYWSSAMYDQAEAHRAAGGSLAFFGANAVYWRCDFGNGDRTIYVNKANDAYWWRKQGRPEGALVGLAYGATITNNAGYVLLEPNDRFFAGTGLTGSSILGQGYNLILSEIDFLSPFSPPNIRLLARTVASNGYITRYAAPSGGQVFAAGTIGWPSSLDLGDPQYLRGVADPVTQKITLNVVDSFSRPRMSRGDCNCDGTIDGTDETGLIEAVYLGQAYWEAQHSCAFFVANDVNGDGEVNAADFATPPLDSDGDSRPDIVDNCPSVANASQSDCDGDGLGDECDTIDAPAISQHPESESACTNSQVTMYVTATGPQPITYQWRKNGANIPGANGSTFTLSSAAPGDTGTYDVVVATSCAQTISQPAQLSVQSGPLIVVQPDGESVDEGQAIDLLISADGLGSLGYQWRQNGIAISGATQPTLSIPFAAAIHSGAYDVVVTDSCGAAVSNPALVNVHCSLAISQQPQPQTVCAGGDISLGVGATGFGTVHYQWRKDGAPIEGAIDANFALAAATIADAGSYDVYVFDSCGAATSAAAIVTVRNGPVISTQPVGGSASDGGAYEFSVAATGIGAVTYQWRHDGVELPDATTDRLTINPVAPADAGSYDVFVSDDCGPAVSDSAPLNVTCTTSVVQHPSPQTVCAGSAATFSVVGAGQGVLTYQWRKDGTEIVGATFPSYVVDPVSPADAGSYSAVVTDGCGTAVSSSAALEVRTGPLIDAQPVDGTANHGGSFTFSVAAHGIGELHYQWRREGADIPGASGSSLTIDPVSPSDAGSYDVLVSDDCGPAYSVAANLAVDCTTFVTQQPASQSACPGASVTFTAAGSGVGVITYQWRKDGDPIADETNAALIISAVAPSDAGQYAVVVGDDCGVVLSDAATLTIGSGPAITTEPQAASVADGGAITFSVAANGLGVIRYQWRHDGADIPGATSDAWSIDPAWPGDAGDYDVVVTDDCGSATSAAARLTVTCITAVTQQPSSIAVCAGASAAFAVVGAGHGPLSYQWRKDGVPIDGATLDTLTIDPATPADAGSYTVVVSDSCGTATSDAALLTLQAPPTIALQPVSETARYNFPASFSVAATGDAGALSYQWRKDGVDIPAATGASYSLANALPADAGVYDAIVTNSCGSTTSDPATLTVGPCQPCDLNCDGSVNPFDIQPFIGALKPNAPTACSPCAGDTNHDGTVNPFDIQAFLECLGG